MPFEPLEEKRMYRRGEEVGDKVWEVVAGWDWFAKRTVGAQITDAIDSIGANITEAGGRFHPNDVKKFLYYARGSLRESVHWLRRCRVRKLVSEPDVDVLLSELEQLSRELNLAINFQKNRKDGE